MSASNPNNDEINELIKGANDPEKRAVLIVLQSINAALVANTKTINDIDEQLKEHLVEFKTRATREDELYNKGKGAWKIVSWGLGCAQALILWLALGAFHELQGLHQYDTLLDKRITTIEQTK